MRGRGRDQPARRAALDEARTERQPLRHGRARAVLPEVRHVRLHGREERADALVEQVARQDHIKAAFLQPGFFERGLDRGLLQLAFGQLPRFLPHAVVPGYEVELRAQRAFALFFAGRRRVREQERPVFQLQCALPDAFYHPAPPPPSKTSTSP